MSTHSKAPVLTAAQVIAVGQKDYPAVNQEKHDKEPQTLSKSANNECHVTQIHVQSKEKDWQDTEANREHGDRIQQNPGEKEPGNQLVSSSHDEVTKPSSKHGITRTPDSSSHHGITRSSDSSSQHGITRSPDSSSQHGITRSPDSSSHHGITRSSDSSSHHGITRSSDSSSQHGITRSSDSSSQHGITRSSDSSSQYGITRSPDSSSHHGIIRSSDSLSQQGITRSSDSSSQHGITRSPDSSSHHGITRSSDSSSQHGITRSTDSSSQHGITRSPDSSSHHGITRSPDSSSQQGITRSPDSSSHHGITRSSDSSSHHGITRSSDSSSQHGITRSSDSSSHHGITRSPDSSSHHGITRSPDFSSHQGITRSSEPSAHQGSTWHHLESTLHERLETTQNRGDSGSNLGIFFSDTSMDISWMVDVLSKDPFNERLGANSFVSLSESDEDTWKLSAGRFSFIIFYHSMTSNQGAFEMRKYLENVNQILGQTNGMVVIVNLEDKNSEKELRDQWNGKWSSSCKLLTFTKQEMRLLHPTRTQHLPEESMWMKLNHMKQTLSETRESSPKYICWNKRRRQHRVVIFSGSDEDKSAWLQSLMESQHFRREVKSSRYFDVSKSDGVRLEREINECTFAILHSTSFQAARIILSTFDQYKMKPALRKEKVIAVFDSEDWNQQTLTDFQNLANETFLFSREEVSDYLNYLQGPFHVDKKLEKKWMRLQELIKNRGNGNQSELFGRKKQNRLIHLPKRSPATGKQTHADDLPSYIPHNIPDSTENKREKRTHKAMKTDNKVSPALSKSKSITIFSRSGQNNYEWLQTLLRSDLPKPYEDVRPFYISNSNEQKFTEEVFRCKFGILYHTKKHGRINLTDVTDSLYANELKHLSGVLGRNKVVVIIDDLETSGSEEKERILQSQPSIRELAQELFIFSSEEKKSSNMLEKYQGLKKLLK